MGTGTTGGLDVCKIQDGMDAPQPCTDKAPPGSFDPEVQWSWGDEASGPASVIPLVANFTDDNGDLEVDLCDTPDVVLVTWSTGVTITEGDLRLFDGATGALHWTAGTKVRRWDTPAIGDVDGDGLMEIVTRAASGAIAMFDDKGAMVASGPTDTSGIVAWGLADLDADGDVEIYGGGYVLDHQLAQVAAYPTGENWSAHVAVDLDGDDDLEILADGGAYHHDGTVYFPNPGLTSAYHGLYPHVADFDGDLDPEVLYAAADGAALLDHQGNVLWEKFAGGSGDANRPMAIHDFDGDDAPEFGASALGGGFGFGVYEATPGTLWTGGAVDTSGQSGGTAFDFLGAGIAQSVYADEKTLWVYDEVGTVLMQVPRSSLTQIEYPVVADVDNDGSAELLVVSNPYNGPQTAPSLQVIRDVQDRWVPARRIWNQHTYHVTNVLEDGTIPQVEPKHWTLLNTFRTQAQVAAGGGVCEPEG
ncbi:MAG: hypothetical protein D6705_14890 [Deltaproteobacteria bacterium]|nr:MAG: hypothetical protein D6705_14890 [Deltaproteobacteria bacterium]